VIPAGAQTPSLGAAQSFAVLGGQSVTVAGTGTTINGDVGVSPGTSITGIPGGGTVTPPFSTHPNDSAAVAAQAAVASLYASLAGASGGVVTNAELGSVTLTPGTYSFTSTANIAAGTTLTLSGAGTYIFKVGSALTANVGSNVVLTNGASACNIFWQVTSEATLNGVAFAGTVVAQAAVTVGVGARLDGRALTTSSGAVTMAGGNVVGGCSGSSGGCPTIALAPATLPGGTAGVAYSQTLTSSGGVGPYAFSVASGSLPTGLTLSSTGVLSGTPSAAGSFTVTVRATDANGCASTRAYTITVVPPSAVCPAIGLAPSATPGGTAGTAYTQVITATGGSEPYTFDVAAGTLAPGLTLTSSGVLAGTPTTAGTSTFTIRATDANGCSASNPYTLQIAAAPQVPAECPAITLAPTTLPGGTAGVSYSQTITGAGGVGPYSFGISAGALPAGLLLTSAGSITGTPGTSGSATFTVRGTAANGCFGTAAYTLTIAAAPDVPSSCPAITLSPASLPNGVVSTAYNQTITASGGTGPYAFGATGGALPAGLMLSAAGVLSGTPTAAGQATVTIRGTAANGCFTERAFGVSILNAVPTLPQLFMVLLAASLMAAGFLRLRRRAQPD
jgi:hypothetical protein